MRSRFTILVAAVVVAILLTYAFAFQVGETEVAVVETFGNVDPPATDQAGRVQRTSAGEVADPGSLVFKPGPYFKWPWPIQKVTTYSTTTHHLESELYEVKTRDGQSVVVKSYLTWRVDNPYALSRTAGGVDEMEQKLQTWMSNLSGLIGANYDFRDLVNSNPDKLKRDQLETQFTKQLRQRLANDQASYGIRIESFGLRRVLFPEDITPKVLARQAATRQAVAETIRSQGESQAQAITDEARLQKDLILAFARSQAEALRAAGDAQAAQHYKAFAQNEDFAVFLRKVEALEKILPHNTTYILDAKSMNPFDLLNDAAEQLPRAAGDNAKEASQTEPVGADSTESEMDTETDTATSTSNRQDQGE
jgi:membrane protease subunit HflC